MVFIPENIISYSARSFKLKCLMVLILLNVGHFYINGQDNILDRKYSFSYDSLCLVALFDSLAARYDFSFSYDASVVSGDSVVFAKVDSVKLDEWLLEMLDNEDLEIHVMENQIIISAEPARVSRKSIHIQGVVVDSLDQGPMSMVNIGVEGKTIGTATNIEGRFSLFLPLRYAGEKLFFSNLGYLRKQVEMPSEDTTLLVTLRETSVRLPEVLVRHVKPDVIMSEVNRRKSINYADDPLILTAFFRETIQQDEQFVNVSEAVIEIFKPPYSKEFAQERVRFVRGRKGVFSGDMELINFKLQGGPFLFSRVDIVRQGGILPDKDGNSQYEYSFEGMDYEHGRDVFVVGFEPRNDTGELLYEGKIRVDEETFAVVGATFEMTRKTIRKSREYLIRRDSRRFRTRPSFARYRIDYRPWGEKWVLNSVRGEVSMRITDREKRMRTVFHTVSEMLVTDLRPGERKEFRWSESFKSDYILSDEIESYDSDFWKRYNILRPDESIEKIFESGEKEKKN
jgi:hypothetical protein